MLSGIAIAASRTWWIAHTARRAAGSLSRDRSPPQDALNHFANYAVHYHIVVRSRILRSPIVLAEFVRALLNEAKGIKAEQGGLELFRRLNLAAGVRMLDILPRHEIPISDSGGSRRDNGEPRLGQ